MELTKCRGQFESFTEKEQLEIQKRCQSEDFSTASFIISKKTFANHWDEIKSALPEERTLEESFEIFSSIKNILQSGQRSMHESELTFEQAGDAMKTLMRLALYEPDVKSGGVLEGFFARMTGGKVEEHKFETPKNLIHGQVAWLNQGCFEKTLQFNGQMLRVFVVTWGGSQLCPFQSVNDKHYHGYDYGSSDIVVTNLRTKETLSYSSLLPHMIKHHSFLEGPFCWYRIDPKKVVSVLGSFQEGKSYRLNSYKAQRMKSFGLSGTGKFDGLENIQATFNRFIKLENHNAYCMEDGSICITPADNTDGVSKEQHTHRLKELHINPNQLEIGWHHTFRMQTVKIYNWNDWL